MSRVEDNYKFALEEGNRKIEGSTTECAMQLSTMLIRVLLDISLSLAKIADNCEGQGVKMEKQNKDKS